MRIATIAGTGMYAPERVVTNDFFNKMYNKDIDSFLRTQRNIIERRWMDPNQCTSDLIIRAAEEAMKTAGITADLLDLIVVSTDTPDYISPSTAAVVQHKLKAKNAGTFDINTACAGFVAAVDLAAKYIVADPKYKNILVVGAYAMSKWLNFDDFKIASLFADGAGAAIIQPSKNNGAILASELYSDGQYHDYMGIYAGGTRTKITHEVLENRGQLLNFAKKIPTETNAVQWPRLTNNLLDRIGKTPQDISHFFLTQLNIETINSTLKILGLEESKSHNVMDKFGYTGSACIPMAIADAADQHLIKKGDLVFMLGSGGGMSMAALAMTWGFDT